MNTCRSPFGHVAWEVHGCVPPEVHRQLAMEAAEEDISLNRLVSAKLSS
jgi:predicted HicB family RNase H-like nuclease